MKPLDRDYIVRNDVVHRYVIGGLTAEELAEFEVFLMEHPDILEAVTLEQVFQEGLRHQQQEKTHALKGWLAGMVWSWPTAAATAFLVFAVSYLGFSPKELAPNMPVLYVHEYRSANLDSLNTIVLEEVMHSHVLLVLQPGNLEAVAFDVSITNDTTGKALLTQQSLNTSLSGDITVPVALSEITKGRYKVVLNPIGSDQAAEEFVINVM